MTCYGHNFYLDILTGDTVKINHVVENKIILFKYNCNIRKYGRSMLNIQGYKYKGLQARITLYTTETCTQTSMRVHKVVIFTLKIMLNVFILWTECLNQINELNSMD